MGGHLSQAEKDGRQVVLRRNMICRCLRFLVTGAEESPELLPFIQFLFDATILHSPTTNKTRRLPLRLVARKVLRNTNMGLYGKYAAARRHVRDVRKSQGGITPQEVLTQPAARRMQEWRAARFGGHDTSRRLENDINEVYLWHGCSYDAVDHIFHEDFRLNFKSHVGLFGKGLYFAESCAKADDYSTGASHRRNWYKSVEHSLPANTPVQAMLLCRIVLGKVKRVNAVDYHQTLGPAATGEYDSLIGDRKMHRREFVLYSKDTVFPEFAVLYQRDYNEGPPDGTLTFAEFRASDKYLSLSTRG